MKPIKIYYCYAPQDRELQIRLEKHLMSLKRLGQITLHLTHEIVAGTDWKHTQNERFQQADLILLLISPDFIASDYHYGIEMHHALEKHEAGNVWVTAIILRPTLWERTPLEKLQKLPKNGRAITARKNRDEALLDVVKGISEIVALLLGRKLPPAAPADEGKVSSGTQKAVPIVKPRCITCGDQNTVTADICINCGDLLYDMSSNNEPEGAPMAYQPEKIEVKYGKGSVTASFMLRDMHRVTYSTSGLVYIDGKGAKFECEEGYRFTIEEVDCFLYFILKMNLFLQSKYEPHLEIGGHRIF